MDKEKKLSELKKRIDSNEYKTRVRARKPVTKKKKRRFNIVNLLFLAFLIYVLVNIIQQNQIMSGLDKEIEDKNAEKAELEQEVSILRKDVEKINDPDTFLEIVEKIARNEYKMVKPYETIYIDRNKNSNNFISEDD